MDKINTNGFASKPQPFPEVPAVVIPASKSAPKSAVVELQEFLNAPATGEVDDKLEKVFELAELARKEVQEREGNELLDRLNGILEDALRMGYIKPDADLTEAQLGFARILNVPDPEALFTRVLERLQAKTQDDGSSEFHPAQSS